MVATRTGSYRPPVMGTTHAVSTGHYLASATGMRVLENGGNAIDAGVAAGICLNVLLPEMCGFGGVAPIMVYLAEEDRVISLNGVGPWPAKASVDYFMTQHGGVIPSGVARVVVPVAAGAWLTALEMWGTKSFAEVVGGALGLARDGFPLHFTGAAGMPDLVNASRDWESSLVVFAPKGRPIGFRERFVQSDLANTFEKLINAEKSRSSLSREAGIRAAREEFYSGGIGEAITGFVQSEGGLLDSSDLANFEIEIEDTVTGSFGEYEVYACGPWSQGPVLVETLQILRPDDFRSLAHNSAEYIHLVTEALNPWKFENRSQPDSWNYQHPAALPVAAELDTSYACAVDRWGNAFSATPSDGAGGSPIVPGLGFVPSNRGAQSWLDKNHPAAVEGGKRPRLTPNPAIAFRDGKLMMPFGTPGGDAQPQSMTQIFLNMAVNGMNVQAAVEAPRFMSSSFPNSFYPHSYRPGVLQLERAIEPRVGEELSRLGHSIEWLQTYDAGAGAVCAIEVDPGTRTLSAGADMRRESYAIGR